MATSTCPKCNSTSFEMAKGEATGSQYKFYFVQCSSCGAVVGTQDYYSIPILLKELAEKLNVKLNI